MILLHLAAILWYQLRKRQPLLQAMIKGSAPGKHSRQAPRSIIWAIVIASVFGGALWAVVNFAPSAPSYF
jgi:hypothetical protein